MKEKLFVTVELYQGLVHEVRALTSFPAAERIEKEWIAEQGINDEISRECKAASGTEFHIFECPLENQLEPQEGR